VKKKNIAKGWNIMGHIAIVSYCRTWPVEYTPFMAAMPKERERKKKHVRI
jgi:hypothetical protein